MRNYFAILNRRTLFLTDRIASFKANGRPVPSFDIAEREALIWAVDKLHELAQRLLDRGESVNLNNTVEQLTERIKRLEEGKKEVERSREVYKRRLKEMRRKNELPK